MPGLSLTWSKTSVLRVENEIVSHWTHGAATDLQVGLTTATLLAVNVADDRLGT